MDEIKLSAGQAADRARILIVDDDPMTVGLFSAILRGEATRL